MLSCNFQMENKMPKKIDRTGQRFGRLVVLRESTEQYGTNGTRWDCLCDCGNTSSVGAGKLQSKHTRSCGCLLRDTTIQRSTKHGMAGSKEYEAWSGMKKRCSSKDKKFQTYFEKEIKVCPEWLHSFEAFFDYIGYAPENSRKWSVGRIDNNRDYEPGNVRWELDPEQARNHSRQKNNTSGTTGVCLWTDNRRGSQYWVAFWNAELNTKKRKLFSINKHGNEKAKQMAIEYRAKVISELESSGIIYAESHGTLKEEINIERY